MSDDPFQDVPLFREIERLLASNTGPLNYEIARQVAKTVAQSGSHSAPGASAHAAYQTALRNAEHLVAGFTQLQPAEPMRLRLVSRPEWIDQTFTDWGWLLEAIAGRFTTLASPGEDESPAAQPLQIAMEQISPLLLGIQTGQIVGAAASSVLTHYDAPIPRPHGDLLFVFPNIMEMVQEYDLDEEFGSWLAVREVAHHVVPATVPWITPYWRSLLTEIVDAVDIDTADLERKLIELQSSMQEIGTGLDTDTLLPVLDSPRHRAALDRLRAFGALLDGYASLSLEAVTHAVMGSRRERFVEADLRRHAESGDPLHVLRESLGLLPDRRLETSGATFCAAITKLRGLRVLNRVWDAPDNLPTLDEIKDPFVWIDRISPEPSTEA